MLQVSHHLNDNKGTERDVLWEEIYEEKSLHLVTKLLTVTSKLSVVFVAFY